MEAPVLSPNPSPARGRGVGGEGRSLHEVAPFACPPANIHVNPTPISPDLTAF
ncbi:hypothetical protein CT19431_240125 [Cupriavidus taiwanensis]|nr:hypothetical protein CT19431_240125 [Cupriavidus taiwanensis]